MPQRSLGEIKAEQTQLRTRVGQLVDEAREIEIKMSVDGATDGLEERKANIERGKAKASARLQELGAEYNAEVTRRYEAGAFSVETGTNFDNAYTERETRTNDASAIEPHRKAALDGALRCLERTQHSGVMSDRAATAMEGVVRHGDPSGSTARYLAAVADPAYFTAFGKLLQYGSNAGMRMSSEEHRAVERVTAIDEERSMMDGIGASGGFAIPIEIDPTILLSSSGVLNPVRQVARVVPMASSTLRLVSSTGVTASYGPEGAEQTDGSPTLVQPTLTAQRGSAFVPFSIEIGQDWPLLAQELAKLFADERDVLDSLKFLSGTGIAEPQGILATGGLTSTQEITTATGSTTANPVSSPASTTRTCTPFGKGSPTPGSSLAQAGWPTRRFLTNCSASSVAEIPPSRSRSRKAAAARYSARPSTNIHRCSTGRPPAATRSASSAISRAT